ncbi:MAG TPA: C39 family peptidase [Pseudomonadales bacterium]
MLVFLAGVLIIFQMVNFFDTETVEKDAVNIVMNTPAGVQYEQVSVRPLSEIKNQNVVRQKYDFSCGSAALTTVLNYYLDVEIDEVQAVNAMLHYGERENIIQRRGFSLLDMKRFVSGIGYKSGGFKGTIEDLKEVNNPAIVQIIHGGFKHFVVLRKTSHDRVFLADPAFGNFTMTIEQFEKVWESNVLFIVYQKESLNTNMLALSENDLRYVDADEIKRTALSNIADFRLPLEQQAQTAIDSMLHIRP